MRALTIVGRLAGTTLLLGASSACGFVVRSTHDGFGRSFDELSVKIAEVEARRAANEPSWPWVDEQDTLRNRCESWDEALGILYARRSSAIVRDQTYVSATGTLFATLCESSIDGPGAVAGAAGWTLIGICFVPVDVVVAPFWFARGAIGELGVSEEDLVRAATDLQRARQLGVRDTRVDGTGHWGWPYPHNTHLDVLGYDADWLRRHTQP